MQKDYRNNFFLVENTKIYPYTAFKKNVWFCAFFWKNGDQTGTTALKLQDIPNFFFII